MQYTDRMIIAGAFLVSAVSATGGFFIAKKVLDEKYQAIADEEIAQAKDFYSRLHNKPDPAELVEQFASPVVQEPVGQAVDALKSYGHPGVTSPGEAEEGVVVNVTNVFTEAETNDTWDLAEEMKNRSEQAPYIISNEEFLIGEKDYEQESMTYYEGDGVLADSRDQMVPESDDKVGDLNLQRFGHGSKDKNMLFVRNDKMELDFEIALSEGEYAKEVMGFEHSEEPRRRKPRRSEWADG